MPNWCSNSATIRFPTKEKADEFKATIERVQSDYAFKDSNGNEVTILGHFVPEPNYENDDQGWYWWRVENWGTKWDITLYDWWEEDDCAVSLTFDSAWSPPIESYRAMQDQDIVVHATYYEPGMCFVGSFEDGEDVFYNYSEISDPDEVRDYIGESLDDEYGVSETMRMWAEEEALAESGD